MKKDSFSFMLKSILITILLTYSVLSTPFYPIEAGTFYITSSDLKGIQQKSIKQVQLQTPYKVFQQNLNIGIVCSITQINIDQRVSLQFTYVIKDKTFSQDSMGNKQFKKIIQITILDKKGFNYPEFKLGVDFFIAQNLRTDYYNITHHQQHLMNKSITQQEKVYSNKEVHNQLFIFPNGFSSFNLTHKIMYGYSDQHDMYTIHYMTGMGFENMNQGWNENKDFVFFRYVLYPRFPFGYKQCEIVYQNSLVQNFYYSCDKKNIDGYFYGLMGSSSHNFSGKFISSRHGFSFQVEHLDQGKKYNVIGFPFKLSEKFNFIDHRKHDYNFYQQRNFFLYVIIAVVLIVGAFIIFIVLKKKKIVYFDLQQQKTVSNQQSTTSNSTSLNNKKSVKNKLKSQNQNNYQKNSDQSMKQAEQKGKEQKLQTNEDAISQNFDIQ